MIRQGRDYLLFDGECGICTYSAEKAKEIDNLKRFVIDPSQSFSDEELLGYGITREDCNKKLRVITKKGRVYSGAFAINYFLWQYLPWKLPVILIYLAPPLLLLELIVYRLVADNRHRISRMLGMKACSVRENAKNAK